MALREIDLNGTKVYVEDEIDEKETGIFIDNDLEDTQEIETISEENLLEDTSLDIFGDENE